jgi:uncharacterized protein YbaA (DUF1428 family)
LQGLNVFNVIYNYRVPQKVEEEFLHIQSKASEIYRSYGSLEQETFVLTNQKLKFRCVPFSNVIDVDDDERVFVSLSRFRGKAHHDDVMRQIDSDLRIDRLFQEITGLIDLNRVIRGEFENVI